MKREVLALEELQIINVELGAVILLMNVNLMIVVMGVLIQDLV